ncbi:MAG: hypothetical protein EBR82_46320 [Caulobacteraceae bacterium]|nr:hypothetical protein [Caulobacteraceae bacterium]
MKIAIGNDLNGGVVTRDMTEAEVQQWEKAAEEAEATRNARIEKDEAAASARAKLAKLGLTEAEITAIIGG